MKAPQKPRARRTRKAGSLPRRLTAGTTIPYVGRRCIATAHSGKPCGSPPLHGKKKCRFHLYPKVASEMGARGGRRRAIFNPDGLEPFAAPKSAGDLLHLMAQTIVEVRSGKVDPRVANSISYLGAGFLKAVELVDLEARLAALEKQRVGAEE